MARFLELNRLGERLRSIVDHHVELVLKRHDLLLLNGFRIIG